MNFYGWSLAIDGCRTQSGRYRSVREVWKCPDNNKLQGYIYVYLPLRMPVVLPFQDVRVFSLWVLFSDVQHKRCRIKSTHKSPWGTKTFPRGTPLLVKRT